MGRLCRWWWAMWYIKTHPPGWVTHKWENNYNHRGSSQGARSLSHRDPQPTGPGTSKMSRENIWL